MYSGKTSRKLDFDLTIRFFTRVDRVLRRSLGVSELAKADATVKPAPPVEPELPQEDFEMPEFEDWSTLKERLAHESSEGNPQVVIPRGVVDVDSDEIEILGEAEPESVHDEL